MKNRKKIKFSYFIISLIIVISAFLLKPFIECSDVDAKIFRNVLLVLSGFLIIPNIINVSKIKKKGIINFVIILIGIVLSALIYQNHSKDYKIRNELYFNSIFNKDNSIATNSVVSVVDDNTNSNSDKNIVDEISGDILRVNYIDVNQGDSIFIELPNKEIMLIDAGESYYSKKVIDYIDNLGYKKIDYVVGTHPHTDHIGGLESIIKKYDIRSVYMPKKQSNSRTFLNLLKAIKEKNLKINTAKSGVSIIDSDNLKVKIISPTQEYNDSNNSSAVIKINYINRCFLFMGDAEIDAEKAITDDLDCDVVKIGHHGSDTSSSESFVKKTKAKYAIVSVGANNKYKHPYDFVLKRWEDNGAKVLRTDQLGDIVISTDGSNLVVNNEVVTDNKKIEKTIDNKKNDSKIEIVNVSTIAGETGEIKIKGEANKEYSIKLYYSSGISKAKGLESKTSDNEGYVTWNFNIPKNTKRGNYKFMINDYEFEYELK